MQSAVPRIAIEFRYVQTCSTTKLHNTGNSVEPYTLLCTVGNWSFQLAKRFIQDGRIDTTNKQARLDIASVVSMQPAHTRTRSRTRFTDHKDIE